MNRPTKNQVEFGFIALVITVLFVLSLVSYGLVDTLISFGINAVLVVLIFVALHFVRKLGR